MDYQYRAVSPDAFISQVVRYVVTGHVFYFTGRVPRGRNPRELDGKLIESYGADVTPWTRSRQRSRGVSSVHYLRCGRTFILLASEGRGPFFEQLGGGSAPQFRDMRRVSLEFDVYAVRYGMAANSQVVDGLRQRHPRRRALVRLNRETYSTLKAFFVAQAHRHPRGRLEGLMWSLGFYPYRPVLEQLWAMVRAVNRVRRRIGLQELDARRCIRRRKPPLQCVRIALSQGLSSPAATSSSPHFRRASCTFLTRSYSGRSWLIAAVISTPLQSGPYPPSGTCQEPP
jgi:hypothetical protein